MEQGGGPAARAKPSELVDRVDEDTYRTVSEEVQAIHVQLVDCAGKKSAAARELRRGGVPGLANPPEAHGEGHRLRLGDLGLEAAVTANAQAPACSFSVQLKS